MGMHSDNIESPQKTFKRQLEFKASVYQAVDKHLGDENKRMNLVAAREKLYLNDIIPVLVGEGLLFRKLEIYIPEDKKREFMKDYKFLKLLSKAQVAMEAFKEYQDELMTG